LYFFFLPFALTKNSRTMLNRIGDCGHLCLILTLGEMVPVFPN
jgi:hypothetical protein